MDLPDEMVVCVLGFLDIGGAYNAGRTCKRFYKLLSKAASHVAGGWQHVPLPLLPGETALKQLAFVQRRGRQSGCPDSTLPLYLQKFLKPPFDTMQVAVSELKDGSHALILDAAGRVWSMGRNTFGGLGREGDEQLMPIPGLPGTVRNVTVSHGTSAVVLNNGELWVWGRNLHKMIGQQALIVPIPTRLTVPEPVVQVAIGTAYGTCHVLAVTRDGSVYGAGSNAFYQLGLTRNTPDQAHRSFTRLYSRERVIKAAAGSLYSILLLSTGRLLGCGHTFSGELGCGQVIYTRKRLTPVFKSLCPILDVEARHQSTAVITRQGQLYLCGSNTVGWEHLIPTRVEVDEPIVSCALTNCYGVVLIKTASGLMRRYCGSPVVTL